MQVTVAEARLSATSCPSDVDDATNANGDQHRDEFIEVRDVRCGQECLPYHQVDAQREAFPEAQWLRVRQAAAYPPKVTVRPCAARRERSDRGTSSTSSSVAAKDRYDTQRGLEERRAVGRISLER